MLLVKPEEVALKKGCPFTKSFKYVIIIAKMTSFRLHDHAVYFDF